MRSTRYRIAVVVGDGHVAGAQPAVGGEGGGGGLVVVPVAEEHVRPPDPDLPGSPGCTSPPPSSTRRTSTPGAGRPIEPARCSSAGRGGDRGRRLGQPVALGQDEPERLLHHRSGRLRQGGPGHGQPDGRELLGCDVGRFARRSGPHVGRPGDHGDAQRATARPSTPGRTARRAGSGDPACSVAPSTTLRPKMWNSGSTPRATSSLRLAPLRPRLARGWRAGCRG